ncbi:MAG: hypothetical protein R3Y13_01375 [bacterium]
MLSVILAIFIMFMINVVVLIILFGENISMFFIIFATIIELVIIMNVSMQSINTKPIKKNKSRSSNEKMSAEKYYMFDDINKKF